jgi:hypothetical protein
MKGRGGSGRIALEGDGRDGRGSAGRMIHPWAEAWAPGLLLPTVPPTQPQAALRAKPGPGFGEGAILASLPHTPRQFKKQFK